jgi:hypothetical protein
MTGDGTDSELTDSGLADTGLLTPERVAGLRSGDRAAVREAVGGLPRPVLAAWLGTADGEVMLRDAFDQMPGYYIPGMLDQTVLARWEISRPPAAAALAFDLLLAPDGCQVREAAGATAPAVTLVLDAVSFVELASAAQPGMDLLLQGRLHVRGDVQLAIRMESLFGLGQPADGP